MRKVLDGIVYGLCFVCLVIICARVAVTLHPCTLYENSAVVVEIEDFETVVVEDATGNLWAFNTATDGWRCGQEVVMLMDSVGTEDVTDDVICKVRRL